jgi:hypothetical protein
MALAGDDTMWFLPSALEVKVKKFNQARVNGGSIVITKKTGHLENFGQFFGNLQKPYRKILEISRLFLISTREKNKKNRDISKIFSITYLKVAKKSVQNFLNVQFFKWISSFFFGGYQVFGGCSVFC